MDKTRTEWFNGKVKPLYPGVYEREFSSECRYAYWTGTRWRLSSRNLKTARRERAGANGIFFRWRGLAVKP